MLPVHQRVAVNNPWVVKDMDLTIDSQEAKLTATADIAAAAAREAVGSDRRLGFTFILDIYLLLNRTNIPIS